MTIALASDHAGFEKLKELKYFLESLGHECKDFGPQKLSPNDDYPDFIKPAAEAVATGECHMGIIMGGDGEGEAMAANRIKGVRCALFYGPAVPKAAIDITGVKTHDPLEIVKLTRQHNNANILSLAARFLNLEEIKHVSKLWLETEFSGDDRHQRRIEKLDK